MLSVGPGWDWTTLINLYGNPETYTQQIRALESSCTQNPQSASGRFVLAYHYLTQGHSEAALDQLKAVVTLQPKDQLSAQLIQQLEKVEKAPSPGPGGETPNPPSTPPSPEATSASNPTPSAGKPGKLEGTWIARPAADTTITVTFQDQGHFLWKVSHQGQDQQFKGNSSDVNGILTLAQDQKNAHGREHQLAG